MFPGASAPRQEETGWALASQTGPRRGRACEGKNGSEQVPVAMRGYGEDNQAVHDVASSKQPAAPSPPHGHVAFVMGTITSGDGQQQHQEV